MEGGRASPIARTGPDLAAIALLVLLAAAVLSEALFGDRVLLPASLLRHMLPWSRALPVSGEPPAWNPLLWDGIAQFYPWRRFAAEWVARGIFPLWNPHHFCGTPFFANSQSALFYPINALFYLPGPLTTAQRFAWVALVHLSLAGGGTHCWLRALGCGRPGAFLAGTAFMLSGFVMTWLELPTFLSVACWIPLLLLAIHRTLQRRSFLWAAAAGIALGLMLLGGHLQIAFYGLLAAGGYTLFQLIAGQRGDERVEGLGLRVESDDPRPSTLNPQPSTLAFTLGATLLALALGFALAAPQVLPALEMSRFSHRASVASPEGYRHYVGYAVPAGHLITLFLPDFFGNPTRNRYWGAANYAEYCGYTGAATLLLALVGTLAGWRRTRAALYLAVVALLSLWMSAGSPLNALFYFGIPGFGQSGSPGRILVLFCLAVSALAGVGLDTLLTAARDPRVPARRLGAWLGGAAFLWGVLFLLTRQLTASFLSGNSAVSFTTAWSASALPFQLALILTALAAAALAGGIAGLRTGKLSPDLGAALAAGVPVLVVLADLYFFATAFLLTSPAATVYPPTALTQQLAAEQRDGGRMLPLNQRWSITEPPGAVLPPNAALAYGLDDVQGYDSLYLGRFKALANEIQRADTSPQENGNMLFLTNVTSPLFPLLGVRRILSDDSAGPLAPPSSQSGPFDGVTITHDPRALPRAFVVPRWRSVAETEALPELAKLAVSGPKALWEEAIVSTAGSGARIPNGTPTNDERPPTNARASSPDGGSGVQILEAVPNRVRVGVHSTAPGLLVVTDNHYPGWGATIESGGRSEVVTLLRANHTFRAVPVPAGASTVTFRFEPGSLRFGLFLAVLAVAGLGAAVGGSLSAGGPRRRMS